MTDTQPTFTRITDRRLQLKVSGSPAPTRYHRRPMRKALLSLLLLASCVTPRQMSFAEAIGLSAPSSDAAAATLAEDVFAHVVVRHAPGLADVEGGLPMCIPPSSRPIINQPFTLAWTTRPTAPFPSQGVQLFVSLEQPPDAQLIPNGRGGMLMVPNKYTFTPGVSPFLTQQGGKVRFDYTFPPHLLGLRAWMQLVVKDARTGVTVSPMFEMTVGNR